MDETSIVTAILTANAVIALIYLVMAILKKDKQFLIHALVIILCPVVGFLLYMLSELFYKMLYPSYEYDKEDVTFSKEVKKKIQKHDFTEETKIIPMEESLIASNESERRTALLNNLKKGSGHNINLVVKAVQNEDAETAHYAASAVTSLNASFLSRLKEFEYEYQKDKNNYEILRNYSDCRLEFISSGILSQIEKKNSLYLYLDLMKRIFTDFRSEMTEDDYRVMIAMFLELSDAEEAVKYSNACMEQYPDKEASYLNQLKTHFKLGKKDDFFTLLDQLKKSDIFLSKEGLDLIRLFS